MHIDDRELAAVWVDRPLSRLQERFLGHCEMGNRLAAFCFLGSTKRQSSSPDPYDMISTPSMTSKIARRACLTVFAVALGASLSAGAAVIPALTAAGTDPVPAEIAARALQARSLKIDLGALSEVLEADRELGLDLFPSVRLVATSRSVELTGPESFTWRGSFRDDPNGSAVLVVSEGVVAGGFTHHGRRFQIEPGEGGRHYLLEVASDRLPDAIDDGVVPGGRRSPSRLVGRSLSNRSDAESSAVIDLAVFFTRHAVKSAGGKRALKALVKLGIAETNAALADSRIDLRLELAKLRRVPYPKSVDIRLDLERLQAMGDGYLDKAHKLRDRHDADVVLLVVEPGDVSRCGAAFLSPLADRPADWAFGVIRHDCISPSYSFGHELGHIMGLGHPTATFTSPAYRPYGVGYYEPEGLFRTMMATKSTGAAPRVLHFSNPLVEEMGVPTGREHSRPDAADSARALAEARQLLTAYR